MSREYDNDDVPLRVEVSGFPSLRLVERVIATCAHCGATFEYKKKLEPKEYCSGKCSYAHRKFLKQQAEDPEWKEKQEEARKERAEREREERERDEKLAQERKPTIDRLRAEGKSWAEIAEYFKGNNLWLNGR